MPDVSLNGIEFKIKGSSDAASDSIDKLIGKLNDLQSALKQTAGVKQLEVGMSSVRTSVAKNISTWERFKSAVRNVTKVIGKFAGTTSFPIKKVASGFKEFAGKIGGVVSGFKRILGYRMIRAIIKDIAKAMEEGAKAAYFFSKNLGDKTKYISKMLDSLSASSKGLGSQMGAAWATLLAAITPIVNQIVAIISRAIQVITQFFALLGRSGFYLKAKNATSDWADETARGAGAAKEWKNQLMGFDELNRLNEPGGGGGGGGSTDYGSMFEEVPVEQGVKDFFNSLKEAFDAENWEQLGTLIGEKINDIVENGIAWGEIGTWVGEKINALFTTEYWTLKTINFQNIGAKVAELLNNVLGNINFSNLGGIIAEKLTILPDLLIGAINNLNFKTVGKSIHDIIVGFFSNLSQWVDEVNWEEFAINLGHGIEDMVRGLQPGEIISAVATFALDVVNGFGELLGGILSNLTAPIVNFFNGSDLWNSIKNAFAKKWNDFANWANQFLPENLQLPPAEIEVEAAVEPTVNDDGWNRWKQAVQSRSASDPASASTTANLNQFTNSLQNSNKPSIPTKANFNAFSGLTGNAKPSIGSTAYFNSKTIKPSLLSGKLMKFNSQAYVQSIEVKKGLKLKIPAQITQQEKASGGVFTNTGWKPITNYASGGSPFGGQIFRARENGNPELVGTLKGSTAVMNNDQIVSSVAAGVARSIAGIHFQLTGLGTAAPVNPDNGANEEMLYRAMLRALNSADREPLELSLDGQVVYRSVVRRNRMNTMATGVNALT